MEGKRRTDQNLLLDELSHVQELMKQLQAHLEHPSVRNTCQSLVKDVMLSIRKAVNLAKLSNLEEQEKPPADSGRSGSGSQGSENSDHASKEQEPGDSNKKRKSLPRWTSQMQVKAGVEESSLDDGYHWRKYGQKEILGAKHPRGYYRCTHRHTCGCPATKQVQRTDNDPSVFDVTYHGHHICHQKIQQVKTSTQRELQQQQYQPDSQQQQQQHQLFLSFQSDQATSSYSFPSIKPVSSLQPDIRAFSSPLMINNGILGNSSPTFFSQTSSESRPCLSMRQNLQAPKSELPENISPAISNTTSSTTDMDFMLDPNIVFDATNFLD